MRLLLTTSPILIAAAAVPAIVLLGYIYRKDRLEKESWRILIKLVIMGIISTALAIVTEQLGSAILDSTLYPDSIAYGVLMYFGVVACSEEGFKYLLLRRKTWRSPEFNCQFDGVVYAVFVSLGFALWENIGYVAMYGFSTALARALTAVPGHACFGVFMGAWYGMAKKYDNQGSEAMCRRCRRRAFWLPVMIHGAYDFIASGYTGLVWEFFVFIIVLFILALRKVKKLSAEDEYIDDQGPTFY